MPVTIREGFKKIKKFFHTDGGRGVSKLVIFPKCFFFVFLAPKNPVQLRKDPKGCHKGEKIMVLKLKTK